MSIIEHNKLAGLTDRELVQYIGTNLQKLRLKMNRSQQEIADFVGLERATLSKLENGRPATLLTFVQVLRALKKLDWLKTLEAETQLSPLQMAALQGKVRKNASRPKKSRGDSPNLIKPEPEW